MKRTKPFGRKAHNRQATASCSICRHPDRPRMEVLIAGGASIKAVAKTCHVSYWPLYRHWSNHVSHTRRQQLLMGPVPTAALAARLADENCSVLDNLKYLRLNLYRLFDAAVEADDRNGGSLVAGKLHENLNQVARITGELSQSPLVVTQNNFYVSPQFAQLQGALLRVLADYPEARAAVIHAFRELESQTGPALIEGKLDAAA